jgi:hypothetical protein
MGPPLVEIDIGNSVVDRVAEPSGNSYDLYVSKRETEQVRMAIQKLSEEFREIILLREYEELSYLEIASVLECPVGTVMSRLGRARAKLRALLPQRLGTRLAFSERRKVKASCAPVRMGSSVAPARIPQKLVDHLTFLIAIRTCGWYGKLLFACLSFTRSRQPFQGH